MEFPHSSVVNHREGFGCRGRHKASRQVSAHRLIVQAPGLLPFGSEKGFSAKRRFQQGFASERVGVRGVFTDAREPLLLIAISVDSAPDPWPAARFNI